MWVSRELGPSTQALTGAGVLKRVREPVLVLVGPRLEGASVYCDWLFTHPGLVPGPYELTTGLTVIIPPGLCSLEGKATPGVTLEVP